MPTKTKTKTTKAPRRAPRRARPHYGHHFDPPLPPDLGSMQIAVRLKHVADADPKREIVDMRALHVAHKARGFVELRFGHTCLTVHGGDLHTALHALGFTVFNEFPGRGSGTTRSRASS
jgi:hypothetical protein